MIHKTPTEIRGSGILEVQSLFKSIGTHRSQGTTHISSTRKRARRTPHPKPFEIGTSLSLATPSPAMLIVVASKQFLPMMAEENWIGEERTGMTARGILWLGFLAMLVTTSSGYGQATGCERIDGATSPHLILMTQSMKRKPISTP
jgi:hypothetical protein